MKASLIAPEPATSPTAKAAIPSLPIATPARQMSSVEVRARILYVDDELPLRRVGELVLVRLGYAVDTAADGAEAWAALQHAQYNLLITDNDMPRLTGLELASNARRAGMRLPIMMTSGSLGPLQDPAWKWLDLAAFLPKPFAFDALVTTVEQVLLSANSPSPGANAAASAFTRIALSRQHWSHGGINE